MPETISIPAGRRRIYLMDELRGFAVFCMIFYHGFYTVGYIFNIDLGTLFFRFFMPAEPFYAGLFMFISGIACNLSHSNLKRGLKLLALAVGVSLATYLVIPDQVIVFGILHFLSVCMILSGLLMPLIDRFGFSWTQVAACAALYLFTMNVERGFLGPGGPLTLKLPDALYRTDWLAPFGMYSQTFRSSDYFSLLPWVFVFFAGVFVGKLAKDGRFPEFMYKPRVPAFSWMGRHALILYLAHQPVIYGVCLLISNIVGRFAR